MTTATLRAELMTLVTLSDGRVANAAEYLAERLRQAEQAGDRKAAQMIRLALRHAGA